MQTRGALTPKNHKHSQKKGLGGSSTGYVASQLVAKTIAGAAQLYAIYVLTKILNANEAALAITIIGYSMWIQVFEFGISQALQNTLNSKKIRLDDALKITAAHNAATAVIALVLVSYPAVLDFLASERLANAGKSGVFAFAVGIGLSIASTNNNLLLRLLLVTKREKIISRLMLTQSILSICILYLLERTGGNLLTAISLYLMVPLLTYTILRVSLWRKMFSRRHRRNVDWALIVKESTGFWGLTSISSLFLGVDFFFAAKYLTNEQITAYHLTTRLFFFSHVAYFSYIQIKAKYISQEIILKKPDLVWAILGKAVRLGVLTVLLVMMCGVGTVSFGLYNAIFINQTQAIKLILVAGAYYGLRVSRDVGLVILWNLGEKRWLYLVHTTELLLSLLTMRALVPKYGGGGILAALCLVGASSIILIYYRLNIRRGAIIMKTMRHL